MNDSILELEKEIETLDERLKDPLDQAGVRPQAQALLKKTIEIYSAASEDDRERIRLIFQRYAVFAWAAALPQGPATREWFRRQLLHFSIMDQGTDSRDAVVWLDAIRAKAAKARVDLKPILKEVAALSSNRDRYGMGSTQEQLRRAV